MEIHSLRHLCHITWVVPVNGGKFTQCDIWSYPYIHLRAKWIQVLHQVESVQGYGTVNLLNAYKTIYQPHA